MIHSEYLPYCVYRLSQWMVPQLKIQQLLLLPLPLHHLLLSNPWTHPHLLPAHLPHPLPLLRLTMNLALLILLQDPSKERTDQHWKMENVYCTNSALEIVIKFLVNVLNSLLVASKFVLNVF